MRGQPRARSCATLHARAYPLYASHLQAACCNCFCYVSLAVHMMPHRRFDRPCPSHPLIPPTPPAHPPSPSRSILTNNQLSGALPDSWSVLNVLRTLDATNNSLSGELPAAWAKRGALPQLNTLSLPGNKLEGSLPAKWGSPEALPALAWLDASRNNLSGSLPDAWGAPNSFPRLRVLHLDNNRLSGTLPTRWSFNATMQQLFSW